MPTATINHLTMHYEQYGAGEDLVLIAGLSASHAIWLKLIEPLSKHYRVTVFDNRGAGLTQVTEPPYSIEQMADDTAALLAHLQISNAYILGHSMGGFVLQALLARHPHVAKKAIISCCALRPSALRELHRSINKALVKQRVPREIILKNVATFLFASSYLQSPNHLESFVKGALHQVQSDTGYNGQDQAIAAFDRSHYLANIKIPLLGIYGAEDLIAPPESIEILKQHVPHVTAELIAHCGHMPQFEKPAEFIALIKQFCN